MRGTSLWRAFPWDPQAPAGAPFSAPFIPSPTGRGRFDLPRSLSPVLYLAESAEHAVAELIHPWRGRTIDERHLRRAGRELAVVEVTVSVKGSIPDLCGGATLDRMRTGADAVASRHRDVTQPIARAVWENGGSGLRWWSRFSGDWHTTVLFTDRWAVEGDGRGGDGRGGDGRAGDGRSGDGRGRLEFSLPEVLDVSARAVREAATALGVEVRG